MSKEIVPRLIQLDQPEWEMEAEQPVMFKERRGGQLPRADLHCSRRSPEWPNAALWNAKISRKWSLSCCSGYC